MQNLKIKRSNLKFEVEVIELLMDLKYFKNMKHICMLKLKRFQETNLETFNFTNGQHRLKSESSN